jgi:hypothetical protein
MSRMSSFATLEKYSLTFRSRADLSFTLVELWGRTEIQASRALSVRISFILYLSTLIILHLSIYPSSKTRCLLRH